MVSVYTLSDKKVCGHLRLAVIHVLSYKMILHLVKSVYLQCVLVICSLVTPRSARVMQLFNVTDPGNHVV